MAPIWLFLPRTITLSAMVGSQFGKPLKSPTPPKPPQARVDANRLLGSFFASAARVAGRHCKQRRSHSQNEFMLPSCKFRRPLRHGHSPAVG
jgi:hypothetical protein